MVWYVMCGCGVLVCGVMVAARVKREYNEEEEKENSKSEAQGVIAGARQQVGNTRTKRDTPRTSLRTPSL